MPAGANPASPTALPRVAMVQFNSTVGAIDENCRRILDAVAAAGSDAELIVFPEMAVTGYPLEDLALRPALQAASVTAVDTLARDLQARGHGHQTVVVGHVGTAASTVGGRPAPTNCASVLRNGDVIATYAKRHLPNYGVFDEYRIFTPGTGITVIDVGAARVGIAVCEDLWQGAALMAEYRAAGIHLLVVPNASPFERDKDDARAALLAERAQEVGCPVVYVNSVGGQDELIFDGGSFAVDAAGSVTARMKQFTEASLLLDERCRGSVAPAADDLEQVWQAITLGVRDYVHKNGARSVLIGVSGGIDSAVVAAVACDAVGAGNVHGVSMPSRYSSQHSRDDAADLAARTGLHLRTVDVEPMIAEFSTRLQLTGLAAENVQARVRGTTLMAISNSEGHLVLAPGNKSELACGYSTVYGDTVGAYAPIKDVFKVDVWALARWRNDAAARRGETAPIPPASITKEPSAELRPDQLDSDSLPPYELLDAVLESYIERDHDPESLIAAGIDAELVQRVVRMVDAAEWKRRQYPPGPKVSRLAFGRDRRLPISARPPHWSSGG
ncbi:MAG: NAD+ synthase [Actinomycetales bacterium]|nr:NAD+ synthase [Actinomycetales bacterium]